MIVTPDDLVDYMSGINLNAPQESAAEMVLQGIQADLERYLNRPLEPRVITESVRAHSDGYLLTTVDPIISMQSTDFLFYGGRIWAAGTYGSPLVLTPSTWFTSSDMFYTVTYTAGLDARPASDTANQYADVRLSILRVASREMTNRHDDTLSVKGLNTENVGEPTGPQNGVQGWTMDELRIHDRLRKRVMV